MRGLGENYLLFTWKLLKITGLQFSCALSCWYFRDCLASLWGQTHPIQPQLNGCWLSPKKVNYFLAALATLSASELTLNYLGPGPDPTPASPEGGRQPSQLSRPGTSLHLRDSSSLLLGLWTFRITAAPWIFRVVLAGNRTSEPKTNSLWKLFSCGVSIAFSHRRIRTPAPVPLQV